MTSDVERLIGSTDAPVTPARLRDDLAALGIAEGGTLIVHCAMSTIGWIAGGAQSVVDALIGAVGPTGTVTMPAHSGDWSDPSQWVAPPVPANWWDTIDAGRPGFDPYATPLRAMGAVAENLLLRRATLRSGHPLHSHMAHGFHAGAITARHDLDDSFGDSSPLGRLYEMDATIVLIGVGHERNTSLHLAEARASWEGRSTVRQSTMVMREGSPHQVEWDMLDHSTDDFTSIGDALDDGCLLYTSDAADE